MHSKYPYIFAIFVGITIPFIPELSPFPLILGLIYFLCGSVFGFLWPVNSWRWGIWIAGPAIVLIGLSVLFAGYVEMFLKKDLPILLVAIISSCLGSLIFSRIKLSRTKVSEK